jgi:hypothetical protein
MEENMPEPLTIMLKVHLLKILPKPRKNSIKLKPSQMI